MIKVIGKRLLIPNKDRLIGFEGDNRTGRLYFSFRKDFFTEVFGSESDLSVSAKLQASGASKAVAYILTPVADLSNAQESVYELEILSGMVQAVGEIKLQLIILKDMGKDENQSDIPDLEWNSETQSFYACDSLDFETYSGSTGSAQLDAFKEILSKIGAKATNAVESATAASESAASAKGYAEAAEKAAAETETNANAAAESANTAAEKASESESAAGAAGKDAASAKASSEAAGGLAEKAAASAAAASEGAEAAENAKGAAESAKEAAETAKAAALNAANDAKNEAFAAKSLAQLAMDAASAARAGAKSASDNAAASLSHMNEAARYSEEAKAAAQKFDGQLSSKVDGHIANTDNPHGVTAEQVGAYTKTETDGKIAEAVAPVESDVTALEGAVAGKLDKVSSFVRVYPGVYATNDTDGTPHLITATSDLSYIGTSSGYIPLYAAGGQLKTATPTADDSAANKGYVDESTDALKIHGKKIGSVVRIDDAFDAEYAKVSCTSSVKKYGKNLIPYPYANTTKTINGVTFTDNGDGSVTANGTATADAIYSFITIATAFLVPSGTYTISGVSNGSTQTFYIQLKNSDIDQNVAMITNGGVSFALEKPYKLRGNFIVKNGTIVSNIVFKPQLERGGVATDYEPYKEPVMYTPNTSGKVDIPLYSDTTTLVADGAIITADYTRNTTDVINNIEANSKPYELIETITLTEATEIIERSSAPNGTAYGFAKLLITVDTPKADVAAQQNVRLYLNGDTLNYYAYYQSLTTYAKRAYFDCTVENGILKIWVGNGSTNSGGENAGMVSVIQGSAVAFLSAINKIKLKGEAAFASGTIIKIYGVRA